MLNRSTRWSFELVLMLGGLVLPALAHAAGQDLSPRAKPAYEGAYVVIGVGSPAPLPEVTVVAPSAPLPIHEIVVEPVKVAPSAGEELVFARIERDEKMPKGLDLMPDEAPGPALTPPPPFGTHRNVIEL